MAKNERLRQVIDGIKFRYKIKSQKELVERMGCSSATYLSDMLSGKSELSELYSDKLKETYLVNPEFLQTGQGSIWIDENISVNQSGSNNTQVIGDGNQVAIPTTLDRAIDEISEMRKVLTEAIKSNQNAIKVNQENTSRLLSIIEKMIQ